MFNVTRKTDPQHASLTEALANVKVIEQFDYNALGQAYNGMEPGEIVDFPFNRDKQTSLIQQLNRRGLVRNVDYKLVVDDTETDTLLTDSEGKQIFAEDGTTPLHETVETAFITRITAKPAQMIVKSRGKRDDSQEGGAQLSGEPIQPTSTTTPDGDGNDGEAVAQQGGAAPAASLGTPVAARTAAAPAKASTAPKAPAKGAAPARPSAKR